MEKIVFLFSDLSPVYFVTFAFHNDSNILFQSQNT